MDREIPISFNKKKGVVETWWLAYFEDVLIKKIELAHILCSSDYYYIYEVFWH